MTTRKRVIVRSAVLSECGRFRYVLRRSWESLGLRQCVTWIMLNPSTADAQVDDPTIRRCMRFSEEWGYGSLIVVNLFAFRTAYPRELRAAGFPEGPGNDEAIVDAARESALVVAGWGAIQHPLVKARARHVFHLLTSPPHEIGMECLGLSKDGHPWHPLMVPAVTYHRPLERC